MEIILPKNYSYFDSVPDVKDLVHLCKTGEPKGTLNSKMKVRWEYVQHVSNVFGGYNGGKLGRRFYYTIITPKSDIIQESKGVHRRVVNEYIWQLNIWRSYVVDINNVCFVNGGAVRGAIVERRVFNDRRLRTLITGDVRMGEIPRYNHTYYKPTMLFNYPRKGLTMGVTVRYSGYDGNIVQAATGFGMMHSDSKKTLNIVNMNQLITNHPDVVVDFNKDFPMDNLDLMNFISRWQFL